MFAVVLVGRLAVVQFVKGPELRSKAMDVRMRDIPVEAKRGIIYDRNYKELAVSLNVESVFAMPAQVKDPEGAARVLAPILGMEYDTVLRKLTEEEAFVWLRRKVTDEQAIAVRQARLPGVHLTQESRRVYPKGNLAAHIIGISGIDSQGLEGVELVYDGELRGSPGRIVIEYDARNREIPQAMHRYFPPQDGHNLVLTIDETIQYIVERELDKAMLRHQAKHGLVVVLDPRNGEILAMAVRPDYDPNTYQAFPASNRRNFAISDAYSPGSTFKPITGAAALDEGVARTTDSFSCGGALTVQGEIIRCHRRGGHGGQTFVEIVKNSCNVGHMTLALRLGKDRYYKYLERFNLLERTGIDLPGEAVGIAPSLSRVQPVDLACMSFGQTLTVTPLQLAAAIAAIANEGVYIRPHVAKEIRTASGEVLVDFSAARRRQVISKQSAADMVHALTVAVHDGTGKRAIVPGYMVAGKTGTAQKAEGGRIIPGRYIGSFVGFAPAEAPQVLMLVMIDEPAGAYYGGTVAAPVFQAAMKDILNYLGVPATATTLRLDQAQALTPDIIEATREEAESLAKDAGLAIVFSGEGSLVLYQFPPAGTPLPEGGAVHATLAQPARADGMVSVPGLAGRTLRECAELLARLGLRLSFEGSGMAVAQDPEAGTWARLGTSVQVKFSP